VFLTRSVPAGGRVALKATVEVERPTTTMDPADLDL
jgi:hypothetical protein